MTRPVPNLRSALVDKLGKIIPPWNTWFQQFTQPPSATDVITVGASPFSYTANNIGQVVVRGGTVSLIQLLRGATIINMTGALSILVSIGDTVKVTYSVLPTIQFLEL